MNIKCIFSLYCNNNATIEFTLNCVFTLALLLIYKTSDIYNMLKSYNSFSEMNFPCHTQVVSRGLFVVQGRVRSQSSICGSDGRSGTGIFFSEPFFVSVPLTIPPMLHSLLRVLSGTGTMEPSEAQFQAAITHV